MPLFLQTLHLIKERKVRFGEKCTKGHLPWLRALPLRRLQSKILLTSRRIATLLSFLKTVLALFACHSVYIAPPTSPPPFKSPPPPGFSQDWITLKQQDRITRNRQFPQIAHFSIELVPGAPKVGDLCFR